MDGVVLAVFGFVYLGMILGGIPGLAVDRTGVALLGAIALLVTDRVTPAEAWNSIDVPTMALLLGLMVVSAQFRLGGFYSAITHRLAAVAWSPPRLLFMVVILSGGLSALLANDIVCLAVAPLLIESCFRRGLAPLPFLLALACAANVGSAATLIGNPQNMLIGQRLNLSFSGYLLDALVPAVLGCVVVWAILVAQFRGRWEQRGKNIAVAAPPLNRWQTFKGLSVLMVVVVLFLEGSFPREVTALAAGGVLLLSRRLHSREMLSLVDWQLLILFVGLFVVNHALEASGLLAWGMDSLAASGIDVQHPAGLFGITAVLSNLVSNVPAVMLLLPAADHPTAGAVLALSSTLAGNLLIVGSIANIIVVDQAQRLGIRVSWRDHARTGIPVTLATLTLAGGWLWLRTVM